MLGGVESEDAARMETAVGGMQGAATAATAGEVRVDGEIPST
jgi:hypothetical protein